MTDGLPDGPVLITGGRGFLGAHTALRLARAGRDVICVDDGTRDCFAALGEVAPASLRFVDGDVREPALWLPALPRPSLVFHFAALAGVGTYYRRPLDVLRVNGLGTAALVDALAPLEPALFVNISTSEVYGRDAAGVGEADPTPVGPVHDPRWTYAAGKLFGEHYALAAHKAGLLRAVSLRPFNVYGPGQIGEGAVRLLCEAAVGGGPLRITGDGEQTRSWVYVDDFVDALLIVAGRPDLAGRAWNVGSEQEVAMIDLARALAQLGGTLPIEHMPHPGTDVRRRFPDTAALRAATGWAPRVPLGDGLERTMAFWRARRREQSRRNDG